MSVKNVDKVNAVVVGTERIRTGNDLFLTTKRIVKSVGLVHDSFSCSCSSGFGIVVAVNLL